MVQGKGLGTLLLIDALRRTRNLADEVGIRAVEVDAIDNVARLFSQRFDFGSRRDDRHHLGLSISALRRLGLSSGGGSVSR